MERETKWTRANNVEAIRQYLPKEFKEAPIDVACVRILQYMSATEFSQILQITYKVSGDKGFKFAKHRIKHDFEEKEIKAQFEGILTYIKTI